VRQIVDWLSRDFDGVIVFDESHAMQNAAGGKSERGEQAPSQQGRAGLRLQDALPNARVLYVSATGATTVHNLAYTQRLGLWGGADFPFATRAEFVEAIEAGPIATNVKAEKRFLSTIARRLDTLGAITKGQRQTGGQGLFRADDNLESVYARAALRQLYLLLYRSKIEGCSLQAFENATGLRLTDVDGTLREDLPPITTFLNRLLTLTIDLQNTLFGVFEDLLRSKIEGAIASGTYDLGVETVTAESLSVRDRRTLYVHPQSGAETSVFTIARRDRNHPLILAEALDRADAPRARP
jgi:hypothetical protein